APRSVSLIVRSVSSLVHAPGAVAHPQMREDSLLEFPGIGLEPAKDRRVVDFDAAIKQHELEIAVTDRKHQIPTNGPEDHLGGELPPLETIASTHSDIRPAQSGVDHIGNPSTSKFATEPERLTFAWGDLCRSRGYSRR